MKKLIFYLLVTISLFGSEKEFFNVSMLYTTYQDKHYNGASISYTDNGVAYMFQGAKDYFSYKVAKELIVNQNGNFLSGVLIHSGFKRFSYKKETLSTERVVGRKWNSVPFVGGDLVYSLNLNRSTQIVGQISLSASLNRSDLYSIANVTVGCRYQNFRIDFSHQHYAPSKSSRNILQIGYTFLW